MSFLLAAEQDPFIPSFFEMVMQDETMGYIKPAFRHVAQNLAEHYPLVFGRLLMWWEEAFHAVLLVVEGSFILRADSSFGEWFYQLRRVDHTGASPGGGLTASKRMWSIFMLVVWPYLAARLEALHVDYVASGRAAGGAGEGQGEGREEGPWYDEDSDGDCGDEECASAEESKAEGTSTSQSSGDGRLRLDKQGSNYEMAPWRRSLARLFFATRRQGRILWRRVFRWLVRNYGTLHATGQGLSLLYQVLFLFGLTRFWSPLLRLAHLTVERVPPNLAEAGLGDSLASEDGLVAEGLAALAGSADSGSAGSAGNGDDGGGGGSLQSYASSLLAQGQGPVTAGASSAAAQSVLGAVGDTLASAAKWGALGALVGFKLLEWYFSADTQERLAPRRRQGDEILPPPQPPALPAAGDSGQMQSLPSSPSSRPVIVSLPKDKSLCPLCLKPRVNAAVSSGGYVFCYPCLFEHVNEASPTCPITNIPCSVEQIRRVFEPSS